jgi:hypothetical protein
MTRILLCTILLCGCALGVPVRPEDKADLDRAMRTPTTVFLDKDAAADAWGRAQSWVARFSSMKIQTVSDYVIATYNPPSTDVKFGYQITKTPEGSNSVSISVSCATGNIFATGNCTKNSHIAAHYIKTGELLCQSCIVQ